MRSLVVLDFLAAAVAGLLALLVRFGTGGPDVYLLVTLAAPVVWVLSCASVRAYEQRFLGTGSEEFERVFNAGVRLLALTAVVSLAFRLEPARLYVLIALPTHGPAHAAAPLRRPAAPAPAAGGRAVACTRSSSSGASAPAPS